MINVSFDFFFHKIDSDSPTPIFFNASPTRKRKSFWFQNWSQNCHDFDFAQSSNCICKSSFQGNIAAGLSWSVRNWEKSALKATPLRCSGDFWSTSTWDTVLVCYGYGIAWMIVDVLITGAQRSLMSNLKSWKQLWTNCEVGPLASDSSALILLRTGLALKNVQTRHD